VHGPPTLLYAKPRRGEPTLPTKANGEVGEKDGEGAKDGGQDGNELTKLMVFVLKVRVWEGEGGATG
jgi:hypothetical protein